MSSPPLPDLVDAAPETPPAESRRSWFWAALRWLAAIGILTALCLRHRDGLASLTEASLLWVALAVLARLAALGASCVRWYLLLKALRLPVSLVAAVRLSLMALAVSHVSPGAVAGEAVKIFALFRVHADRKMAVLASIGLDRLLGFVTFLAIAAAASLALPEVRGHTTLPQSPLILTIATIATIAFTVLILTPALHESAIVLWLSRRRLLQSIVVPLGESAVELGRHKAALAAAFLLSFLGHFVLIGAITSSMRALPLGDATASFRQDCFAVPVTEMAGALVPLPAGIGFREGAYPYLRGALAPAERKSQTIEDAFVAALLFRTITAAIAGLGAAAMLFRRIRSSRSSAKPITLD